VHDALVYVIVNLNLSDIVVRWWFLFVYVLLYLVTENLILLIIDMVRTRGNLSKRGSHDAPESSAQAAVRRRLITSARRRGQYEADVAQDDVVEHDISDVPQDEE